MSLRVTTMALGFAFSTTRAQLGNASIAAASVCDRLSSWAQVPQSFGMSGEGHVGVTSSCPNQDFAKKAKEKEEELEKKQKELCGLGGHRGYSGLPYTAIGSHMQNIISIITGSGHEP